MAEKEDPGLRTRTITLVLRERVIEKVERKTCSTVEKFLESCIINLLVNTSTNKKSIELKMDQMHNYDEMRTIAVRKGYMDSSKFRTYLVGRFIKECCNEAGRIQTDEFMEAFQEWINALGGPAEFCSKNGLSVSMKELDHQNSVKKERGIASRYYTRISLKV